jgi:hypothetical protein
MAIDSNDARLQYIQNLASSTLNISRDSLAPLLAGQHVAASLQQFFDGEGANLTLFSCCSSSTAQPKCQPDPSTSLLQVRLHS